MSAFITTTDYSQAIEDEIRDRLVDGNTSLLDDAENMAIEFMRGYLSARYDVAEVFNKTGADRNPLIVKYAVDVALFYLYSRISPNAIPDIRVLNYEAAERWLNRLQKGEVNPPDLPRVNTGEKDYVMHGGNTRRTTYLT